MRGLHLSLLRRLPRSGPQADAGKESAVPDLAALGHRLNTLREKMQADAVRVRLAFSAVEMDTRDLVAGALHVAQQTLLEAPA